MDDPFTLAHLLALLAPLLLPLWLWGLWRVRRDLRLASPLQPETARCGLPKQPIGPSPLAHFLRLGKRRSMHRARMA
jgi:hypothetical protein